MNTTAAQWSPWLHMNGFRSLSFSLPEKKKAFLFFQASCEQGFLMVAPAALHADSLSALPSHQPPKKTVNFVNFSQQTGFRALIGMWLLCLWHLPHRLQRVSIFPLFRTTCQQVPRGISSSTGSLLLSSWAAVIGSDQAELYAFAWERGTFPAFFQYYFRVDLISPFHF